MRKDTLYITLSRDITSYTITSGQRAIATNVNYAVTIESPTLTTNLAGRDVSVIISDTEGNTLTTATTFYPDTKNPYKAVTGSLLLDGTVYAKFFDGKPVDTAVRLPIVIRDKSATLLSSDIVVTNGGENAEPSASDETVAGLVNAIRFYDLAEFKAWLDGTKTRDDGLRPTDIVVGQWVHTQQDGSFICKELIGAEPSVAKNFTAIVTQFPLTGTLKMNPDNGVGLSVYSGDVYNEAEATSFSTDAITYKGDAFTFNAGDNQIARQKDNYALESRVNSAMKSTLDAIKADNDDTYAAMLPVMNTTVEARDRAETAASGAKASETRAVTAETNAATSEQNAEASKKSAAVSEANAGLYSQQALAYAQKAETEAATATTKATEASTSASEASVSAGDALAHKNDAGSYAEAARLSAEASAASADSSATSAAASRSSADTAAQSESIAVSSAAAAASSANTASEHKDATLSSATNAATSETNAATSATNAATSSTSASNFASAASDSAKAAATSAADLAEAVATAESLDKRITSLETYGVQFKEDKRLDTTGLTYPLVKQDKSPFSSVYGPNGVTCRYSCNCFRHVLNDTGSNKAYLYSPTGVYQGMLTNTGIGFISAHSYMNCFCLVSTTLDFHYTVFNGLAYNNNKMIISKFSKEDGCPLLRSRQYSKRGVEGSIWQNANAVGPVVWNVKTGHILVFGEYYTNVYNDSGSLVDKPIGYGYLTFDEDLNFVKWDAESDAFVSSETYDETFLTLLPNSPYNAVTAYWIFDGSFMTTFPTVVATTQNNNTTNGLGYLGAHDEIIPITLSSGPYYNAGLDFVPLGGSRLSIDSTGIINYYAPHLMMSSVNADSEGSTARVIKLFNGSRFIYITFKTSENDDGFTYSYRNNDYIKSTEFAGVTLYSTTSFQFLHGKYASTYGDVGMYLYYNGFIYDRSGKYTKCKALSFSKNIRDCSPQRGMYARTWQTVLSPVGDYQYSTGGVILNM